MTKRISKIIRIVIGIAFVSLFAQITFEVAVYNTSIPITGQSFAVLVAGMLLGRKWGLITILCYLLAGGIGLPVFADAKSGWEVFKTGSGGFLIGFGVAAFIIGWLAEKGWDTNIFKNSDSHDNWNSNNYRCWPGLVNLFIWMDKGSGIWPVSICMGSFGKNNAWGGLSLYYKSSDKGRRAITVRLPFTF